MSELYRIFCGASRKPIEFVGGREFPQTGCMDCQDHYLQSGCVASRSGCCEPEATLKLPGSSHRPRLACVDIACSLGSTTLLFSDLEQSVCKGSGNNDDAKLSNVWIELFVGRLRHLGGAGPVSRDHDVIRPA